MTYISKGGKCIITPQISKEDLNWLYYGDKINEIILKLLNEFNPLKDFMEYIIEQQKITETTLIIRLLKAIESESDERKFVLLKFNNEQLKRLYILNEKYKFVKLKEKTELEKTLEEYSKKLVIIKKIIQDNKYNYHIVKNTPIKEIFIKQCIYEINKQGFNIAINRIFDLVEEIYYEGE